MINVKPVKWCEKYNEGKGAWVVYHYTEGHIENYCPKKKSVSVSNTPGPDNQDLEKKS